MKQNDMKKRKPPGYWTKDRCKKVAARCKSKKQFSTKHESAYKVALLNGWLDHIGSHFESIGHKYKRLVYVYEFSDNTVYIGLTYNERKRHHQHLYGRKSPVHKHIRTTGLNPVKIVLSKGYIDVRKALKLEHKTKVRYEKNGWFLLNSRNRDMSLGTLCIYKWDKDICHKEALKYKSRWQFQCNSRGAYSSAFKNGWLDEICSHMILLHKPKGYWTFDRCLKEAKKYRTVLEFSKNNSAAYKSATDNDWLNDVCPYRFSNKKPDGYWNDKENCRIESLKYNNRLSFSTRSRPAYTYSRVNKWLDEFYPKKK